MAIVAIDTLSYAVGDTGQAVRFFEDFGLVRAPEETSGVGRFRLPEGSSVDIRLKDDEHFADSGIVGDGVHEVVWGVDTQASLDQLAKRLGNILDLRSSPDGTIRFKAPFGLLMGLRVFTPKTVVTAPDPLNSPGRINRLNQHRKWRERAWPKVIGHVVIAVPQYEAASDFMREQLNFRLSDHQRGIGMYLRADGSNHHHNIFFVNANAPVPGMDGKARFHHANFGVEDIDEMMTGANHMVRKGWSGSHLGLGRHRIDSALFYYLPCPAGGEAEYGADADYIDDAWVPRDWVEPMFGFAHYAHNLPPFLLQSPSWNVRYMTTEAARCDDKGA